VIELPVVHGEGVCMGRRRTVTVLLTAVLAMATLAATGCGAGRPVPQAPAGGQGFAAGYGRLLRAVGFVRRHGVWVTRLGGVLLVAVGLVLVTGVWTEFVNWLRATAGPGQIGI
jgi:cytochrome c-type biogenesis protein